MSVLPESSLNFSVIMDPLDLIRDIAGRVGLDLLGITAPHGSTGAQSRFNRWIELDRHGEMHYLKNHATAKTDATVLLPDCASVIVVGLSYNRRPRGTSHPQALAATAPANGATVADSETCAGRVGMYAWGRDYHKVLRGKLRELILSLKKSMPAERFLWGVDATPLLETHYADRAGLGFQGKHTLLIHRRLGSWFVIGEVLTTAILTATAPDLQDGRRFRCGTSCNHCSDVCPTGALDEEWQIDARRCISYLTIELKGSIPVEFRKMIGNRVYGCDDCQLICPWNKFAKISNEDDFRVRHGLDEITLIDLFAWTEIEFKEKTEGTAIRRIGYECWLRNIAIGLGNTKTSIKVINALKARQNNSSKLVKEHIVWALEQHC